MVQGAKTERMPIKPYRRKTPAKGPSLLDNPEAEVNREAVLEGQTGRGKPKPTLHGPQPTPERVRQLATEIEDLLMGLPLNALSPAAGEAHAAVSKAVAGAAAELDYVLARKLAELVVRVCRTGVC